MIIRLILIPAAILGFLVYFVSRDADQGIAGGAKVIDARTLVIKARRIRLAGIDAPDLAQTCRKDGVEWPCGRMAMAALSKMIDGGRVDCAQLGMDEDNLMRAVCSRKDKLLNRELVAAGWALASGAAGNDYLAHEQAAQKAGKGLWRGSFVPPWEWRAARKQPQ